MKRLRIVAVVGALLAIVCAPLAYAAGLWFGLPIVAGNTYCQSITAGVPGTTAVCSSVVPAGPAPGSQAQATGGLSGDEFVPADTAAGATTAGNMTGTTSAGPQTVLVPMLMIPTGSYLVTGSVGTGNAFFTSTVPNGIMNEIVVPTGTITNMTITFPSSPVDGQMFRLSFSPLTAGVGVTNLFLTATSLSGTTITRAPTTITATINVGTATVGTNNFAAPTGYSWIYNAAGNIWYRLN